ncbi:RadC family protein [Chengkuizengella axinellae]|uniref:DNA repair protein RadC n=1 Tax=Chengkuizengella axinellae TaxID=3064388 RepID=A0ABT9J3J8_9BACL|nr:DNA repair protein RadC [Chengkuizengella sp. 2205SS18-9]MDP5276189.1 DNA repair protein RadC [Chengkuizengella sp. 2205SS18-9]
MERAEQLILFQKYHTKDTQIDMNRLTDDLLYFGNENADVLDLFAGILGPKTTPQLCSSLSLIGLRELYHMQFEELVKIPGINDAMAIQLFAVFGIIKKLQNMKTEKEKVKINNPEDASRVLMEELRYLKKEFFGLLLLDSKNMVIAKKRVSIGCLNSAIVHPREVFIEAIKRSAASIVCFHNHPSGDPTPSPEDVQLTNRLKDAGKVIGIEILDHIIIGDGVFCSLKERNLI